MAKTIHPRIEEIVNYLIQYNPKEVLHENTLSFLSSKNVTQTEAVVALHFGYNIPIEVTDRFVRCSTMLKSESIEDIAYQTFLYMFYEPDDPNFNSDDDRVQLLI